MSRISIRGVLVGGITDFVSTNVLSFPIMMGIMVKNDIAHMPSDQIKSAMQSAIRHSPTLYGVLLLVGIGCSVLGGYVAASLSKHDETLNGALSSFLCVALGIWALTTTTWQVANLKEVLLGFTSPFLGYLGGYLRLTQIRRRSLTA